MPGASVPLGLEATRSRQSILTASEGWAMEANSTCNMHMCESAADHTCHARARAACQGCKQTLQQAQEGAVPPPLRGLAASKQAPACI